MLGRASEHKRIEHLAPDTERKCVASLLGNRRGDVGEADPLQPGRWHSEHSIERTDIA